MSGATKRLQIFQKIARAGFIDKIKKAVFYLVRHGEKKQPD